MESIIWTVHTLITLLIDHLSTAIYIPILLVRTHYKELQIQWDIFGEHTGIYVHLFEFIALNLTSVIKTFAPTN